MILRSRFQWSNSIELLHSSQYLSGHHLDDLITFNVRDHEFDPVIAGADDRVDVDLIQNTGFDVDQAALLRNRDRNQTTIDPGEICKTGVGFGFADFPRRFCDAGIVERQAVSTNNMRPDRLSLVSFPNGFPISVDLGLGPER